MKHIAGIAQGHERQDFAFTCSEDHELFTSDSTILSHPVTSHFKICLRTMEFQQYAFDIIIIESERIREKRLRIAALH